MLRQRQAVPRRRASASARRASASGVVPLVVVVVSKSVRQHHEEPPNRSALLLQYRRTVADRRTHTRVATRHETIHAAPGTCVEPFVESLHRHHLHGRSALRPKAVERAPGRRVRAAPWSAPMPPRAGGRAPCHPNRSARQPSPRCRAGSAPTARDDSSRCRCRSPRPVPNPPQAPRVPRPSRRCRCRRPGADVGGARGPDRVGPKTVGARAHPRSEAVPRWKRALDLGDGAPLRSVPPLEDVPFGIRDRPARQTLHFVGQLGPAARDGGAPTDADRRTSSGATAHRRRESPRPWNASCPATSAGAARGHRRHRSGSNMSKPPFRSVSSPSSSSRSVCSRVVRDTCRVASPSFPAPRVVRTCLGRMTPNTARRFDDRLPSLGERERRGGLRRPRRPERDRWRAARTEGQTSSCAASARCPSTARYRAAVDLPRSRLAEDVGREAPCREQRGLHGDGGELDRVGPGSRR